MEKFIDILVEETRRLAHSAEVKSLAEHYAGVLLEMGLSLELRLKAESFFINVPLEWAIEGSNFQRDLDIDLREDTETDDISWGRLELGEMAILKALKRAFPESVLVARVFKEDCGCRVCYPVALLEVNILGLVVAEPRDTYYTVKCYPHIDC